MLTYIFYYTDGTEEELVFEHEGQAEWTAAMVGDHLVDYKEVKEILKASLEGYDDGDE